MRTLAVVVVLLLTVGLGWGSVPAMAEDNAVIKQLPSSCQPVNDAELSQLSGKRGFSPNLCRIAVCLYNQLPPDTKRQIAYAVRVAKTISSCIGKNGNSTNGSNNVPK